MATLVIDTFSNNIISNKEQTHVIDTKLSLLMKSLTEFYRTDKNPEYINQVKNIIDQNSIISLRILDWFITNYSKKYRTIINGHNDVYQSYKLQLKSLSKSLFDPFNRKNKIIFYYTDNDYLETSCGQLCFFKWCFENNILQYVSENLAVIEKDMKDSLKAKKISKNGSKKRSQLSLSASRSITKQNIKYTVTFD